MTSIPHKIRTILARMPRMKKCELSWDEFGPCDGRIEWHHVWEYAGRQIQEVWAILGACSHHHAMVKTDKQAKRVLERISLEYATEEELVKYPKIDWKQITKYLYVQ